MAVLRMRLKKKNDADVVLTFVRPDGTHTSSAIGFERSYGPVHDLAHYAVESVLGIERGFLGLMLEGWDFASFESGARLKLPDEALVAEGIAGELSREQMMGQPMTLDEFNWVLRDLYERARPRALARFLTAEELIAIREALAHLRWRWMGLAPGGTLELEFEPGRRRTPRELLG